MIQTRQMPVAGAVTLAKFRQTLTKENGFLVGAAVGAGMTAQAAEAGGADFLVALTAGRMRVMGVPSMACTLPVLESNSLADSFACTEILSQRQCPVFLGVSSLDPRMEIANRITQVIDAGFPGIVNWPTAILYPRPFQQILDRFGVGFERELQLLTAAQQHGMAVIAYVRTAEQAQRAASAGIEIICLNFGWNSGGKTGVSSSLTLEEAGLQARAVSRSIRHVNQRALLLLEGGPLETAEQLGVVCKGAQVSGYIGGSTLERMPVEDSVTTRTMAFKNTASNLARASRQTTELEQWAQTHGLIGQSQALLLLVDKLRQYEQGRSVVFLFGEPGTPIRLAARALHQAGPASAADFIAISARALTTGQLERRLFDDRSAGDYRGLADHELATLLIEHIDQVPMRLQARLARYLRDGTFTSLSSRRIVKGSARLLVSSQHSVDSLSAAGKLHPELVRWLGRSQLRVPALAERADDIAALFSHFADGVRADASLTLSPIALRRLVLADWPENDAQLQSLTEKLISGGKTGIVSASDLNPLLEQTTGRVGQRMTSERDLILDALWRHNFHRSQAAESLGVSRKTLYNKMKRYQLTDS